MGDGRSRLDGRGGRDREGSFRQPFEERSGDRDGPKEKYSSLTAADVAAVMAVVRGPQHRLILHERYVAHCCLCCCLSVSLSVCLFVCLFVCLSESSYTRGQRHRQQLMGVIHTSHLCCCSFVCLSVSCLSVCLSDSSCTRGECDVADALYDLSVSLFVCQYVCLSVFLPLPVPDCLALHHHLTIVPCLHPHPARSSRGPATMPGRTSRCVCPPAEGSSAARWRSR